METETSSAGVLLWHTYFYWYVTLHRWEMVLSGGRRCEVDVFWWLTDCQLIHTKPETNKLMRGYINPFTHMDICALNVKLQCVPQWADQCNVKRIIKPLFFIYWNLNTIHTFKNFQKLDTTFITWKNLYVVALTSTEVLLFLRVLWNLEGMIFKYHLTHGCTLFLSTCTEQTTRGQ